MACRFNVLAQRMLYSVLLFTFAAVTGSMASAAGMYVNIQSLDGSLEPVANLEIATWFKAESGMLICGTAKGNMDEWQSASFSFIPEKTGNVKISLKGPADSTRELGQYQWVIYDNVTINGKLLPNGGFEDGFRNWSPSTWGKKPCLPQIVKDPALVKSGTKSARAWQNGPVIALVPVTAGEKVTLELQFRPTEYEPPETKTMTVKDERGERTIAAPTLVDVPYGPHPKQILYVWQLPTEKPAPILVFIHGGGWTGGNRTDSRFCGLLPYMLAADIAVVSVEYRFIQEASKEGVVPPVKACLEDAARAVQFIRSKAAEWNMDKTRIGLAGGSAGACSSLWLAFHDDMAVPDSDDPVARESTRVTCASVGVPQTTLDPKQMKDWTPNSSYGGHAFGFKAEKAKGLSSFDVFLANRENILPWIAEYSPYALVSPGDPPVYLSYGTPPALGQPQKDPTHTSNFGVKLQEQCKNQGVSCEVYYPGAPDIKHSSVQEFLIETLTGNQ